MCKLRKSERLRGKKRIETLFSGGEAFFSYPFRVLWMETDPEADSPVKMVVSVSSRKFKSAVKRNLIKRRTREAYRLNKSALCSFLTENEKGVAVLFLYTPSAVLGYDVIEKGIVNATGKIERNLNKNSETTETR